MNNVASILSLDVVEGPRPSHKYENAFEIPFTVKMHCLLAAIPSHADCTSGTTAYRDTAHENDQVRLGKAWT